MNDGGASLNDVAAFSNRPGETTEINAQLLSNATADVILQATNDITFYYGVNNTHGVNLTAQAGNDIIVSSIVQFTGNITLAANHNGAGTATGTGLVRFEDGQATAGGIRTITDSLNPPVVPPVNPSPPPSADICTIAPNSPLCQVLSPPTASEPVKPVQQAVNNTVNIINNSTQNSNPNSGTVPNGGNAPAGGSTSSPPTQLEILDAQVRKLAEEMEATARQAAEAAAKWQEEVDALKNKLELPGLPDNNVKLAGNNSDTGNDEVAAALERLAAAKAAAQAAKDAADKAAADAAAKAAQDAENEKSEKTADKKPDTKEVASNDKSGTKNEPVKKMYCN